jgi:hypothetical protein
VNADYLLRTLDEATEALQDSEHRKHLGASLIGRECPRQLWYVFRWALKEKFSARMCRLFERGQLEEARFVKMLREGGATVYETDPETGKQWRILDVDGHFGGSMDGIADSVPQLPPEMGCLLEMKTMNEDAYSSLAGKLISKSPVYVRDKSTAKGVMKAKPEHFVQMQVYMHKKGLKVGLYMAVNKNTDEIWLEFVHYDKAVAERAIARARSIIYSEEGPPRISNSPGRFPCNFCTFKEVCHLNKVPEVNCRTCVHSTPGPEGAWLCAKGNSHAVATQSGCHLHLFNPYLLNVVRVERGDTADNWLELLRHDGTTVTTGPNHVPSDKLTI